jgi:hypothetical protein
LRIKGFATIDTLVDITTHRDTDVNAHLDEFSGAGHVQFRENRGLWQLTPDGRAAHAEELARDLEGIDPVAALGDHYPAFVEVNVNFKQLCGDWQLRNGEPNDHTDAGYDAEIIARLGEMDQVARPIVSAMGDVIDRLSPYATRLGNVLEKVRSGETNMFTGVMCGSFHDVWMELHEDLILTQGIDRAHEGSF